LFRLANGRFEENNAQVLGISCDPVSAHRAWIAALGGMPYPMLSDFHPKGSATQAYGLWNEERGAGNRAVLVIDKEGTIRYRKTYEPGVLPDTEELLAVVDGHGRIKPFPNPRLDQHRKCTD